MTVNAVVVVCLLFAQQVERLEAENKTNMKVKDDTIRRLEKELSYTKQLYQSLREKYVAQQVGLLDAVETSQSAEFAKLKKE